MRSTRKAYSKTYVTSGARSAPEAKNTAPSPPPARSIAGFSKLKAASIAAGPSGAGTPVPSQKVTARGYNAPSDGTKRPRGRSGSAKSGPSYTQGGTSSPKKGAGPTGLGRSGTNYPGRHGSG